MLLLIVLNPRLALGENALALSIEIDAEVTGGAGPMTAMGVRREKAALSSGCKSHPATAPAGSNRSRHGGDEMSEAFG